jgi:high-affinity Fe2+/Pb2+ permease
MRLFVRWGAVIAVSAAGFALAWWVCQELTKLDEGVSLGIAGAVLAVLLAVGAWWAPWEADSGESDDAGRKQAVPLRQKAGDVENTIRGGTLSGPGISGP